MTFAGFAGKVSTDGSGNRTASITAAGGTSVVACLPLKIVVAGAGAAVLVAGVTTTIVANGLLADVEVGLIDKKRGAGNKQGEGHKKGDQKGGGDNTMG